MASKLSLQQIQAQIAQLNAKAEKIMKGKGRAIAEIRKQIKAFNLTAEDLFGLMQTVEVSASPVSKTRGKARAVDSRKGVSAPVKYTDGVNTWAGRGMQPYWLRDAIRAGKSLEDFAIGKPGPKAGKRASSVAPVVDKPKAASKAAAKRATKSAAASQPVAVKKPAAKKAPAPKVEAPKAKAAAKPVQKAPEKAKPVAKPAAKAAAKAPAKTVAKAPAKPAVKASAKPAVKAAPKPAAKPAAKPAPKAPASKPKAAATPAASPAPAEASAPAEQAQS